MGMDGTGKGISIRVYTWILAEYVLACQRTPGAREWAFGVPGDTALLGKPHRAAHSGAHGKCPSPQ